MRLQTIAKTMAPLPLLLMTACSSGTGAQDASEYPERTVRFLVPYSAGGPTDLGARSLMPCFEEEFGGTWVVENKPGGAGALAMLEIANATPDGYTLGVGSQSTFVTTPLVEESAGYSYKDFTHAGQMMEFPGVILVQPDSPYKTIEDLFAAAQEEGANISVGTSGSQVSFSLALNQLAERGMGFTVVPFPGTAEANTALLGGNVDARWEAADSTTIKLIEDGQMRPLATGAEERLPFFPDVPTLAESGITDVLETRTFYGFVGPDGLDPAIEKRLTNTLETCVKSDTFTKAVGENYATYATPDQLLKRLDAYEATVSEILG